MKKIQNPGPKTSPETAPISESTMLSRHQDRQHHAGLRQNSTEDASLKRLKLEELNAKIIAARDGEAAAQDNLSIKK